MFRVRVLTLTLAAGLGLTCGCKSCFEFSPFGRTHTAEPACAPCGSCGVSESCAASPCCEGPELGLGGEAPGFVPPVSDAIGPPAPDLNLPPVGPPPQRLVPQPQAATQPYTPTTGRPRLLSGLGQ